MVLAKGELFAIFLVGSRDKHKCNDFLTSKIYVHLLPSDKPTRINPIFTQDAIHKCLNIYQELYTKPSMTVCHQMHLFISLSFKPY